MNKKQIEFRDPVVERVVDKFVSRSDVGFAKYGVTLNDGLRRVAGGLWYPFRWQLYPSAGLFAGEGGSILIYRAPSQACCAVNTTAFLVHHVALAGQCAHGNVAT